MASLACEEGLVFSRELLHRTRQVSCFGDSIRTSAERWTSFEKPWVLQAMSRLLQALLPPHFILPPVQVGQSEGSTVLAHFVSTDSPQHVGDGAAFSTGCRGGSGDQEGDAP
jgi:hypothetical protein